MSRQRRVKRKNGGLIGAIKNYRNKRANQVAENYDLAGEAVDYIDADPTLKKFGKNRQFSKQLKKRNIDSTIGYTKKSQTVVAPKESIRRASKMVKSQGVNALKLDTDDYAQGAKASMTARRQAKRK